MSRSATPYAQGAAWVAPSGYGISLEPTDGFYRTKLRSGGVHVGIRIWFGEPLEPWTREPMQRGHRWNAECNGKFIEFDRVWPICAGDPIDADEYEYLSSLQAWGEQNAPRGPQANPNKPVDLLTAPILI